MEQIKRKYQGEYVPSGVRYYYKEGALNYHSKKFYSDVENCNMNNIISTCYDAHKSLGLNKRLLERADKVINWNDLIKIEKYAKLILNKGKVKQHIQTLSEQGGLLAKIYAVFILELVRK